MGVRLRHKVFDDVAVNVCQAAVDSIVAEGQPLVVDAQLMQDGGMDVVDLSRIQSVERLVAPLVARPITDTASNAASAQPIA